MEVSVVIPCRGHAHLLEACLRSVVDQQAHFDFEIIVVESGFDDAVLRVAGQFESVRLVRSAQPLFAGLARNLGVAEARGRLIAFIDADCVAMENWLAAIARTLADENVRIVGGPVLDLLPHRWIASADNLLQFVDLPATRPTGEARYFPTCNLALRRADFDALGGFQATQFNAGEDILLCDAASARWPHSLRFEPAMRVRHTGRTRWREYLAHHYLFGRSRALLALLVKPWHLRVGRHAVVIPLMMCKRLVYMMRSGVRYRGWRAARLLVLLPLLVPGLWYAALGFHRGCLERSRS